MNLDKQKKIKYILTLLIPISVVIGLFFGGIMTGIITFEQKSKTDFFYPNDNSENRNLDEKSSFINATIEIYFEERVKYSRFFQLGENLTVFDFLLLTETTGEIDVSYTYWEQYDSYFVDSINYKNKKYEGDGNHFWVFYINDESALEGANKIYLNDNDIIKWEFTEF